MAQIPTQQYTARTYQSTISALTAMLQAKFPDGSWESLLEQDVPLALINVFAWLHEQDALYMNRRWLNDYLILADDRRTVIPLCRGLGYTVRPPAAASVSMRAYPSPTKAVPLVIPAGTSFAYKETYFEFLEDVTIPASKAYWPDETTDDLVVVTEGITRQTTFTSDGTPWQEFEIPYQYLIEGSLVVTVAGEEWEEVDSLIYVEGDSLGRDVFDGDGTGAQQYQLSLLHAIIDPDSNDAITVLVDGIEWLQVSAFTGGPNEYQSFQNANGEVFILFGAVAAGAAPVDGSIIEALYLISGSQKRYSVRYTENEQPTISFGDDSTGRIPPLGASILCTFRVGGGIIGNVDISALDVTVLGYLGSLPNPSIGLYPETSEIRLVNMARGTGGEPRESIDHAKYYAPKYAQSNKRAVTRGDWEVLAATYFDSRYGAPAGAAAKLHQDVPESNQIDIALWSRDSEGRLIPAGESLKAAVRKFLQTRRLQCVYEEMVDGAVYYFEVALAVSLKRNFFSSTVFTNLQTACQNFFKSAVVMPGRDVRINELFRKLNEVEGVYSVTIESITGTILEQQISAADGLTDEYSFLFANPLGQAIVAETVSIRADSQSARDDGTGTLVGDIDGTGTNTVDYDTGKVTITFGTIPVINTTIIAEVRYIARLEWSEDIAADVVGLAALDLVTEYSPIIKRPPVGVAQGQAISFYMPDYLMPIQPGRCFFIGGYGAPVGSPFGGEIYAYDDGDGHIAGNVNPAATNTIDYRTGLVQFTWLVVPYYNAPIALVGQLTQNADGARTAFDFTVVGWPAGVPAPTPVGLFRLDFSAYPTWGAEAQCYINWQGTIFGTYLDNRGDSLFNSTLGTGTLNFSVPPQSPGVPPHQFPFVIGPMTTMLYSSFVFFVKNPLGAGHELYLFADNAGRVWGTTPDTYPTSRLTHMTGHCVARLSFAISPGREVGLLYDSYQQSASRNIPVVADAVGTYGRTTIRELEEEVDL